MKDIIQKEIIKLSCDSCKKDCSEWGLSAQIKFRFGYDSNRDGDHGDIDLCSDCAEGLLKIVQEKYQSFKLKELL